MEPASLPAVGADPRHRALIVLEGEADDVRARAATLLRGESVWLAPPGTGPSDVRTLTGRRSRIVHDEGLDSLVVDLHATVDPDALGATLAAVRGGGLVIVLLPPAGTPDASRDGLVVTPFLAQDVGDRFVRRLRRLLLAHPGATGAAPAGPLVAATNPPTEGVPLNEGQALAVEAVCAVQPGAPVLVVSDHGGGKSSAFGLAAARLLSSGEVPAVVVTGPSSPTVRALLARAGEVLGPEVRGLSFHPIRDLLDEPVPFLMVDEAAGFPVPVLQRLLRTHPRIAFSTTVHGYEGTGLGFADSLRAVLDEHAPDWREVRLDEPVRWAAGDPLEALAADLLLTDAEPAPDAAVADASIRSTTTVRFDRDALANDDPRLREVFGLLLQAHNRTSPSDVRRTLDAPNITLTGLLHDGRVVAVAVVAAEGALPEEDSEAAFTGQFRPLGHMLPEVLATHLGSRAGAELPMVRVVRLAVHPAVRGRGLGTHLMEHVADEALASGAALLGAGFGSTADLIRFWRRCDLHPVRLGIRRGAASGVYSAIVLRALVPRAETLVAELHGRFLDRLPHQLSDPQHDMDRRLAAELFGLPGAPERDPARLPGLDVPPSDDLDLSPEDFDDLLALAFGPRIYDAAVGPCWKLVMRAMSDARYGAALTPATRDLLIAKVLDKRGWTELTESFGFGDLTSAMRAFREAMVPLVEELGGEVASHARARFTSRRPLGPPDASVRIAALRRLGFSVTLPEVSDRRLDRMRQVLERRQLDLQIVLDNIWDPHNAAAILRSADAFAVGAIDLVYTHEAFPRISDMAAGYTKRWSLMNKHPSIEGCYAAARERGLRIVATGPAPGAVSYLDVDWTLPTALVIGHERDGCSEYALNEADEIVIIPMLGFAQSLNVSVATAVLLAEIARQRRAAGQYDATWSGWHDETIRQWTLRDEQGLPWKPIWPPDVLQGQGGE